MAKWKYDLGEVGKKLRDLITEGDSSKKHCEKIIEQLIVCCEYSEAQLTLSDREEYEYDIERIVEECEDTKSYLDEFDYESNGDNMDDLLDRFYDLMDSMRVWVAM